MNNISRNLKAISTAFFAAVICISSVNIAGQERAGKDESRAEYKSEYTERVFCTDKNWSNGDRVSFRDLREITIPATGTVNVDAGHNGGISVKGEDRGDVVVRACVQAWHFRRGGRGFGGGY